MAALTNADKVAAIAAGTNPSADKNKVKLPKKKTTTTTAPASTGSAPVTNAEKAASIAAGTNPSAGITTAAGSPLNQSRDAQVRQSWAARPATERFAPATSASGQTKKVPQATATQRLSALSSRISQNEQQLTNMGLQMNRLQTAFNRGDYSVVDQYNALADRYNKAFNTYVSDVEAYNQLYRSTYRDQGVRDNYARRQYMEQRQAARDQGSRQLYQQRLQEEALRAPITTTTGKENERVVTREPNRFERVVGAGLSGTASGFTTAGGLVLGDQFDEHDSRTLRRKGASVGEHSYKRITGEEPREAGFTYSVTPEYQQRMARAKLTADGLIDTGRRLNNRSTLQTEIAKEGLGETGQMLVDLGVMAVQMAADIGIAAATGGSMLVPLGIRSYGNGYLTAEQMGFTGDAAKSYALGVAAVEVLSEKLFSFFGIVNRYAKGVITQEMSERVIDGLVKRLANTAGGRTALNRLFTILFSAGSEGLEEVVAGVLEPTIRKYTLDRNVKALKEIDWQETLYEGLLGGILGGLGGAIDLKNTRPTYWKYYSQGINESIGRYEEAVKKYGLESKEALQAAKEVWDGGNKKMNQIAGTLDGKPVTYHQLAAMDETLLYGRQNEKGEAVQGPRLADSLNLNNYLEREENARKEAENQRLEAARREEAARLEAEEKARVDAEKTAQSSPQDELTETSRDSASDEGIVRLDTARSAQTRAQAPEGAAESLRGIPEEEMTQEEKDELQYGSGAVEDLGRYTGLAQRLGAPAQAVADNENAADEGGGEASFSIVRTRTMPWRQQVKGYFKKDGSIRSSDSLYLGESEAYLDGVPQAPLYIPTSVITKATRKTKDKSSKKGHELTERDIESLRDGIDNAVAVIVNPSRNALVYITDNRDGNGDPIIAAFDLNHNLYGETAHQATSIHGRASIYGMLDNLGSDAIVYVVNENRLDQMLSGRGIHTSQLLAQVKSIDGSITQNANNSKEENNNGAVYDGSSQRDAGERGRGGAGSLGETAGGSEAGQVPAQRGSDGSPAQTDRGIQQVRKNESHKAKAEKRRQNGAALEKTSGSSEGIDKTDDRASMQILTDDIVEADAELTEIRTRLEDLGFDVRFFLGSIGLKTGGKARGAQQGNTVWICVDDPKWTATQISKHEELHGEARRDPKLIGRLIGRLRAEGTDKLNKITRRYQEALLLRSQGAEERALRVLEEMLCDLYAGINEFTQKNAEARSLHDLIKDEIKSQQAEGVRETRGPPDDGEVSFSLVDTKVPTREEMDAEYMAAVEAGDMEAARRMVEEAAKAAGYDLHLYHGSRKGGGFTVFRDWQYFTGSRKYAERYQERDNPDSLYEVFARSDRMFDTRNAEAAELFEQHRGEYGMGELQENGLPDWTDGYDISEMIEENELDYDGVILDEGGDLVDGEPVSRGPSYILRKSNQVKSADPVTYDDDGEIIPLSQRFDQDKSDIRFSEIEEGEAAPEENSIPQTAADLIAASVKAKQIHKQTEKILRTIELTDKEQGLVNALLSGAITLDELPSGINRRAVSRAYEAKKAARDAAAPVEEYNRQHREALNEEARGACENSADWKNKKFEFGMEAETPRRIFHELTKDEAEADKLTHIYVDPIRANEAKKARMIEWYGKQIEALHIDKRKRAGNKVSEAYAVHYVGELEFAIDWLEELPEGETRGGVTYEEAKTLLAEFWEENPNLDKEHVRKAVAEFRRIYNEVFAMWNEARVLNGLAPVDYRKGYFPHFTSNSADTIVQAMARGMGFGVEVAELPTDIAGLTHLFKPGSQWSGHALQRTGNSTDYNVLEGWDRYIETVGNIIYHTEDIQRWRALERTLRYKHGTPGVRDEMDKLRKRKDLTEAEREAEFEKLLGEDGKANVTHLSAFVQWLNEYTNFMAGKRHLADRIIEQKLSRKWYQRIQKLENLVGFNMLAGNIASVTTNFVPMFQALGNVRSTSMLQAIGSYAIGKVQHDVWADGSDFLVNRKGYDPLYTNAMGKVRNAMFAPFNWVDDFVSEVVVRAKYIDELRNGATPAEALRTADVFAGEVIADRTVGELPVIYNSKTLKVITMFQVEANNDLRHFFKDMPREAKKKGSAPMLALLRSMLRYVIAVYTFNDLFEALFGRRISFDPLNTINDLAGLAFGKKLPNGFEVMAEWIRTKEAPDWDTLFDAGHSDKPLSELAAIGEEAAGNLPFVSGLFGGGRYPVFAFLPNASQTQSGFNAWEDLLFTHENDPKYDWQQIYKMNRNALTYLQPIPFIPGGQLRRTAEGIMAASKEGSYNLTKKGEILQYPILTTYDKFKAAVFGKNTTKGGKEWVDSDFDSLSVEETEAYIDLVTSGSDGQMIYDVLRDLHGDERDAVTKAYALATARLEDGERIRLLDALVSESQSEKFAAMMTDGGLTFRQCAEVFEEYKALSKKGELKDADDSYMYKKAVLATEFADWIDGAGYTDEQKEVITEQYKFWNMVPAEAGNYEKLTAAGVSRDNAVDLVSDWAELMPEAEKDSVTTNQKIGAVAAAGYLSENEKHAAVRSLLKDEVRQDGGSRQTDYDKYVKGYGISVEVFCQYLKVTTGVKGVDRDGDGETDSGSKRDALFAAINSLPLQPGQKTALALYNGSYGESSIRKNAPWLR